jgi:ankyrin repeat protein
VSPLLKGLFDEWSINNSKYVRLTMDVEEQYTACKGIITRSPNDINVQDDKGNTPAHIAILQNPGALWALREAGANFDIKNDKGHTTNDVAHSLRCLVNTTNNDVLSVVLDLKVITAACAIVLDGTCPF